jgi:hypothetical protein
VFAVRFAHVPYALSSLVAGAEKGPRSTSPSPSGPSAITASGAVLLVDAGFYREKFVTRWKPQDFVRPSAAVQAGSGIAPEKSPTSSSRTATGITPTRGSVPNATIWIQKEEYEYYIDEAGKVRNTGRS